MAISHANKAAEYVSYAEHCLKLVQIIPEHESRVLCREMAGEWLKLSNELMETAVFSARSIGHRSRASRAGS